MQEMGELTRLVNERFETHLRALGGAPRHRVEFSRRITTSWALIYYRRHLVRLSPYLFLLPAEHLRHGSHWKELDATLKHEAVHAYLFARTGETGHPHAFHALLARLGVASHGACDLGPENAAFRYVYECPSCEHQWRRRRALVGNWSCGHCAPGGYSPTHRMRLRESLGCPWDRVVAARDVVRLALEEARHDVAPPLVAPRGRPARK